MRTASRLRATPAHPRSRGEHSPRVQMHPSAFGSSPLARGTRSFVLCFSLSPRLIPARAGNTSSTTDPLSLHTAHPRSRGEHTTHSGKALIGDGSSPLARGTLCPEGVDRSQKRLIPARAGNTILSSAAPSASPAHPRSRGEHYRSVVVLSQEFGSSPLARGTRSGSSGGGTGIRLIPARAGNTGVSFCPG